MVENQFKKGQRVEASRASTAGKSLPLVSTHCSAAACGEEVKVFDVRLHEDSACWSRLFVP